MVKIIESKIVPIDSVRENNWNPNVLKGSLYEFLKKSIKKIGFIQPITVTKDLVVIDGAHRLKALKELGMNKIEVKVLDISEKEAKTQTLNLNLIRGTMDSSKLGQLLLEMEKEVGGDVLAECIAMERKQIERAIKQHQQSQDIPKEIVDVATTTHVESGDTYALGVHTLKCGDSVAGGTHFSESFDITITDPPYNVGYKYVGHSDDLDDSEYKEFIFRYITKSLDQSPFVIVTPGKVNERYYHSMFRVVDSAVWFKGFSLTNGIVSNVMVTEPVLFFGKKPLNKFLHTDHLPYHTDREEGLLEAHSCPKPIGLWKELITTFTDIGGTVYDPFAGSGTTIIACELTDRIAFVEELEPLYCQTIINRWEKLTGKRAEKI